MSSYAQPMTHPSSSVTVPTSVTISRPSAVALKMSFERATR